MAIFSRMNPSDLLRDPFSTPLGWQATLAAAFPTLPLRHIRALAWFADHADEIVAWPRPLDDGTLLASKPKGIYKPQWSHYALSVRQALRSPYPDLDPEHQPDGSWQYAYFQENEDPLLRDREAANRGLMACLADGVPIGVFRQVAPKPNSRYHILGLAQVVNWDGGYFFLDSLRLAHAAAPRIADPSASDRPYTIPSPMEAARSRTLRLIDERRGQRQFRRALLATYEQRCAITTTDAPDALEAAHIVPVRDREATTNHPSNGLLLRADLHTLFDLGLVAVEPDRLTVELAGPLRQSTYGRFAGAALRRPVHAPFQPDREALGAHRDWARGMHAF
jgi:hypothetical protein